MKFTLLLAAAGALILDPANPGREFKDGYLPYLTVDPKLAPNTARPDCHDGKCLLDNGFVGGNKLLAVSYEDGVNPALYPANSDFKDYLKEYKSGSKTSPGYNRINLIVAEGKTAGLLDLIKDLEKPCMLTIHYEDYAKLVQDPDIGRMLDEKTRGVFLIPSQTVAPPAEKDYVGARNFRWIVKDAAEGRLFFDLGYTNQKIVIREEATISSKVLNDDFEYCAPQK